jgi:FtsP/CotA-like multicopper oxidase with cupredoxin domain
MNVIGHPSKRARDVIVLALSLGFGPSLQGGRPQSAHNPGSPERIAINDNRTPAGTFSNGVMSIRLDARLGTWHPDAETDPGVVVKAFGVEGGPLQIPGPVIRVREGTEISVTIRNSLSDDLVMHGLYTRPAAASGLEAPTIPPGETREIRFPAGRPGTYFYWGGTADKVLQGRRAIRSSPAR